MVNNLPHSFSTTSGIELEVIEAPPIAETVKVMLNVPYVDVSNVISLQFCEELGKLHDSYETSLGNEVT